MTTPDTTPEADLIKRAQAALDGYDQQDIADYAHLTFASGVVALAAENATLRAELADGSFYKEADIDAMKDTIAALRADNDRLRGLLHQAVTTKVIDDLEWQLDTLAALDAKP